MQSMTSEPATAGTFRGRRHELELLVRLLDPRGASDRTDPRVVLVHGMPGVGKTALAQELARMVRERFPSDYHQTLTADLNYSDAPTEALDALRREVREVRGNPLIILDGVRDPRHVQEVLASAPAPDRTLIVTSRGDLGPALGASSLRLDLLTDDDAIDMFNAVAGLDGRDTASDAIAPVVDIVALCGRLPAALQLAAERVAEEGTATRDLRTMLSTERRRIERLRRGYGVEDGFATEYARLPTDGPDRSAVSLLSQVQAPTFHPWVLCALTQLPLAEAERVCDRLCEAQLIEPVAEGPDGPGPVRLRMHPLVRLYFDGLLRSTGGEAVADTARGRLDEAYHDLLEAAVSRCDPTFQPPHHPSAYLSHAAQLVEHVAGHLDEWLRIEYVNVARGLSLAFHRQEWGLCWRIAARLGGVIPGGVPIDRIHGALELGLRSAEADNAALALVDVRIALAGNLISVERYPEADRVLDEAERLAQGSSEDLLLRRGRIHLRRAEGYLQMRHPAYAEPHLDEARTLFERLGAQNELTMISIHEHLLHGSDLQAAQRVQAEALPLVDQFWVALQHSEEQRRRKNWRQAHDLLDRAAQLCYGDSRRLANVLYRRARLYLQQWRANPWEDSDATLVWRAVCRGTESILLFQQMANPCGEIRMVCRVVQALVEAGNLNTAAMRIRHALRQLEQIREQAGSAYAPLAGRAKLTHGLYLHAAGEVARAHEEMHDAGEIFEEIKDGWSVEEVQKILKDWLRSPSMQKIPPQREAPVAPAGGPTDHGLDAALSVIRAHIEATMTNPPTCFISYAWGNREHERWVEHRLATDLKKAGIKVLLDRWEAHKDVTLARYVVRIDKCDYPIIVGTPDYRFKYENGDPDRGFVVSTEADLVDKRLTSSPERQRSVLPVLLHGTPDEAFPPLVTTRLYHDFRNPEEYSRAIIELLLYMIQVGRDHGLWRQVFDALG